MTHSNIAIIGSGHMGSSLLGGLIANHYPPEKIWITDSDTAKLEQLKNQFKIHTTTKNQEAIEMADAVILAVKPQVLSDVAHEIAKSVQYKKPLIISIAAGVRADSIQKWLGGNVAIVRAMPNVPALIGCGATGLFANSMVSEEQHNWAESILRAISLVVWLNDEKHMDTVTALSGSGPAYFFLIMEALQNAAQELGLDKESARLLTLQTAFGAARMALESDVDVRELRHQVTSPGGTTEQAVKVLEENHLRDIFKKALIAAKERSEELATQLEHTTGN